MAHRVRTVAHGGSLELRTLEGRMPRQKVRNCRRCCRRERPVDGAASAIPLCRRGSRLRYWEVGTDVCIAPECPVKRFAIIVARAQLCESGDLRGSCRVASRCGAGSGFTPSPPAPCTWGAVRPQSTARLANSLQEAQGLKRNRCARAGSSRQLPAGQRRKRFSPVAFGNEQPFERPRNFNQAHA